MDILVRRIGGRQAKVGCLGAKLRKETTDQQKLFIFIVSVLFVMYKNFELDELSATVPLGTFGVCDPALLACAICLSFSLSLGFLLCLLVLPAYAGAAAGASAGVTGFLLCLLVLSAYAAAGAAAAGFLLCLLGRLKRSTVDSLRERQKIINTW